MVRLTSLLATLLLLPLPALADILFEGYSKITSGGVHAGYVVSRYEFDPKSKRFTSTYFLKTGSLGSDVTESLKAVADENLKPLSYEYTSVVGKTVKTIDAKFKSDRMTAVVNEGGKTKTITRDLPKGTFLSTFLVYLMLKSKTGLKTDEKFDYQAIAEEDGDLTKGWAAVGKEETRNGQRAFRILNVFKDIKFISFVTDRGEILETSSPASGIGTELVAKPSDAVGSFGVSSVILKKLFGDVPKGTDNVKSKTALNEALKPPTEPGKKDGVAPGQGIVIKPESKGK